MAGTKNKITDLRNHLFEQLEALKDSKGDNLQKEIDRAKAVAHVAGKIIESAKVEVQFLEASGSLPTNDFFDIDERAVDAEKFLANGGGKIRGRLTT